MHPIFLPVHWFISALYARVSMTIIVAVTLATDKAIKQELNRSPDIINRLSKIL